MRNVERESSLSGGAELVYARAVQRTVRKRGDEPSLSYCQCQVFLYMNFVRCNERERDRERPEHIVCVKCLGTYILYIITRVRERPEYIVSIEVLYINFVHRNERQRERERPKHIVSIECFTCT